MNPYQEALVVLVRRGVVTTDPQEAEKCCGLDRDADGFCVHRPGHPIYVGVRLPTVPTPGHMLYRTLSGHRGQCECRGWRTSEMYAPQVVEAHAKHVREVLAKEAQE